MIVVDVEGVELDEGVIPASAVSANGRWSGACGRVTGTVTVLLVCLFISVTAGPKLECITKLFA